MKTQIGLLALCWIGLPLGALAQELPPQPPDVPLPPGYDPVRAHQQWELEQQRYWQQQRAIFERDFLPWLVQPMTLPNGQPWTRENEEAYWREQLLALVAQWSSSSSSAGEDDSQPPWPGAPPAGAAEVLPPVLATWDLPGWGRSPGGILAPDVLFHRGQAADVGSVPEPAAAGLLTAGLALWGRWRCRRATANSR